MEVILFTDINNCYGFGRDAGAYKIASELRLMDVTVQVIDFFAGLTLVDIQNIVDKYVEKNTLMVAFCITHLNGYDKGYESNIERFVDRPNTFDGCQGFPQSEEWINELQNKFLNKNKNIKFVVGGDRALHVDHDKYNIDYWLLGESETSVVALAYALKYNNKIDRVLYSKDYPYPYFPISNIRWHPNDYIFKGEHLPIEIARGCIFNCSFCSYKKGHEVKYIHTIREEMVYNYEMFGTTGYMFIDSTLNSSMKKTEEICNMIAGLPFKIEWSGFSRLDIFEKYPEMRDMYLESGAKAVQFGIETLNDESIKAINKGTSGEKTKELLYFLNEKWDKKIITGGFFIVGLPEETEKQFYNNIEWLMQDDCPLHSLYFAVLTIKKYNPELSNMISYAPIAKDMKLNGFSNDNKHWVNKKTGLTKDRCIEILEDIIRNTNYLNRIYIDFNFYSRMRNLGYTFNELWNMKRDYSYSFESSNLIKEGMKDEYLTRLLET